MYNSSISFKCHKKLWTKGFFTGSAGKLEPQLQYDLAPTNLRGRKPKFVNTETSLMPVLRIRRWAIIKLDTFPHQSILPVLFSLAYLSHFPPFPLFSSILIDTPVLTCTIRPVASQTKPSVDHSQW